MGSACTGSNCCTTLTFLIIGFVQIVAYLTIVAVASMVAEGFREFTFGEVEYTYITWYCLSILVVTVSGLLCLLAVLFVWANIKRSRKGLQVWVSCMVATCVVLTLTMLAMLAAILRETWMLSDDETYIVPGLATPKVELDRWRISLTPRPVTSVTYLLIYYYGNWLVAFGERWHRYSV